MSYCHVFYTVKYSNYKIDPQYYINKMILLLVKANIASLPACFSELLLHLSTFLAFIFLQVFFLFLLANIQYLKKLGQNKNCVKKDAREKEKKKSQNFWFGKN